MRRLRTFLDSLKLRLTLSALAALAVGMGVVALLLLEQIEHDTIESQRDLQIGETVRLAQILSHRVADLQRVLQVTSLQLDPATLEDPARLAAFLKGAPVLNAVFNSVFVSSAQGELLVRSQGGVVSSPHTHTDLPYIAMTLSQGRPLISQPIAGRITGDSILVFTYPLQHDGTPYGVLAATLQLTSRDLVADLNENGESGMLVVADGSGRLLAHPDPRALLSSLAAQPRFDHAFKAWRELGSPAEPAGLSIDQPHEVVSLSGVNGTDWVVWRAVPEQALLQPLLGARGRATWLVAALLVAMSIVLLALLNWLLRPLGQLERRAVHLFDGQLAPEEGWPQPRGELGSLARVLRQVGTERAQLEALNSEVMKKLGSVMSAAPIGIAFTRAQRFELVSAELCRLLGRAEHELLGQPVESVYADRAHFVLTLEEMARAFARGQPYTGEQQIQRADGSSFWAQLRGRLVDLQHGGDASIWTITDISDQVASRELLEWSAHHDPLTGLANRVVLERRLARLFADRSACLPCAVVAIDLDRFKPINDTSGHAAGDAMLRAVAGAIGSCVRARDLAARVGGDEFVLLLEGCPTPTAAHIAQNVNRALGEIALGWDGRVLKIGASFGVAPLSAETESVEAWLAAADAACYAAKRAGRGTVRSADGSPPAEREITRRGGL